MVKQKILIVDDDKILAEELKLTLEETERFEVEWEERGSKAFQKAKDYKPDLVLMDLCIPDMMGTDIATVMREDPETRKIPIVFFTVLVSREEVEASLGMIGGHHFIAKPASIEEIVGCINETLSPPPGNVAA